MFEKNDLEPTITGPVPHAYPLYVSAAQVM